MNKPVELGKVTSEGRSLTSENCGVIGRIYSKSEREESKLSPVEADALSHKVAAVISGTVIDMDAYMKEGSVDKRQEFFASLALEDPEKTADKNKEEYTVFNKQTLETYKEPNVVEKVFGPSKALYTIYPEVRDNGKYEDNNFVVKKMAAVELSERQQFFASLDLEDPEKTAAKHYTAQELYDMPTLSQGQFSNLKVETPTERVWLSRMMKEDGAKYDNAVEVEHLVNGKWETTPFWSYDGGAINKEATMEKISDYQGWKNYESWAVALWLDNEQPLANMVLDWARQAQAGSKDHENVKENIWSADEAAKFTLADQIKEYVEENNPLSGEPSMYSDVLNGALEEVDYYEIAESYIQKIAEGQ